MHTISSEVSAVSVKSNLSDRLTEYFMVPFLLSLVQPQIIVCPAVFAVFNQTSGCPSLPESGLSELKKNE